MVPTGLQAGADVVHLEPATAGILPARAREQGVLDVDAAVALDVVGQRLVTVPARRDLLGCTGAELAGSHVPGAVDQRAP